MYKKICPRCKRPSFSANRTGTWSCPHCKEDLSQMEAELPSDTLEHEGSTSAGEDEEEEDSP